MTRVRINHDVKWSCQLCGKPMTGKTYQQKQKKFCSLECQSKADSDLKKKWGAEKRKNTIYTRHMLITVDHKVVLYHRHLMQQHLGRKLTSQEIVHHIDMDINNNTINNFYLYENHKTHQEGHGSLNKLIKGLLKDGIIIFDNGTYKRSLK